MFVGGDRNWKNVVILATDNFFFIGIYNSQLLLATLYEIFTRARNTSVFWGVWSFCAGLGFAVADGDIFFDLFRGLIFLDKNTFKKIIKE